jgi:putative endonuclease
MKYRVEWATIYSMYYVYMIKNQADDLYVGVTQDPDERVRYHNSGRGAEYTKARADFRNVFLEEYETLQQARAREVQIKKWRREKKEMLIDRYTRGLSTKQGM